MGIGRVSQRLRLSGLILGLGALILPEIADARGTRRVRPSAPVHWVTPPAGVILDCPNRVLRRAAWVSFGHAIDEMGLEVRMAGGKVAPSPAWTTIRCATGPAAADDPGVRVVSPEASDPELRRLVQEIRDRLLPDSFPRPARVLMLTLEQGEVSATLLREAAWMATYARLEADFLDLGTLERMPVPWLSRYDAVAVLTDRLPPAIADRVVQSLRTFVEAGGGLALLGGIEDDGLRALAGVAPSLRRTRLTRWTCDPTFLPGVTSLSFRIPEEDSWEVPVYDAPKGSQVLCGQQGTDRAPLLFRVPRGRGTVAAWTDALMADKSSRVTLLLTLMEVTPLAAAQLDAHLFFVDDCPLPTSQRPVRVETGLAEVPDEEFYLNRWWPDLLSIFRRFALRPTFAFILTYDDRQPEAGPPPTYAEGSASLRLARAILAEGHEVDLHGFNHQSLSLGRNEWTVGWGGIGAMRDALSLLRSEYRRIFGEDRTPRAYVAPSNFVQRAGKEALRQVFPEVEVLSTQYLDEGPILGQEFGPDPEVPGLWNLPRISSEHFLDEDNAREVLDALVVPGVFSHFIHPDDLLDPERSRGRDWPAMVRELEFLLERLDRSHPWLTRRTASEMATHLRQWSESRMRTLREKNGLLIHVESAPENGLTFLVRPPRGRPVRVQGSCEEVFRSEVESRMVLRTRGGACGIFWQ